MHVLLFPFGSSGDVHPLVGLGLALKARGHAVTLVTNGYFREMLERTGLDFAEMTSREEFLRLASNPELWHPRRSAAYLFREGVARLVQPQYEWIASRYRPGETVVIANCFGAGARIAQEKLGVPTITVHLQPAVLWSEYDSPHLGPMLVGPGVPRWFKRFQFWAGERLVIDPAACPAINAFRREVGLPPIRRTVSWLHSPDCVLGLFPEWYAPRQPDWPAQVHLADFPLWDAPASETADEELETFLAAGEPPIVFTPGSGNMQGEAFFREAVEACRLLGRRGLLVTRFVEHLPPHLPPEVKHVSYMPFTELLPRAAAIVHHGGIGTSAQALRAGIPQLIMPLSHDQPDNARRLRQFGIARSLPPHRFRSPAIAQLLRELLESAEVATACRQVAERFANVDPLEKACAIVEQYARTHGVRLEAGTSALASPGP